MTALALPNRPRPLDFRRHLTAARGQGILSGLTPRRRRLTPRRRRLTPRRRRLTPRRRRLTPRRRRLTPRRRRPTPRRRRPTPRRRRLTPRRRRLTPRRRRPTPRRRRPTPRRRRPTPRRRRLTPRRRRPTPRRRRLTPRRRGARLGDGQLPALGSRSAGGNPSSAASISARAIEKATRSADFYPFSESGASTFKASRAAARVASSGSSNRDRIAARTSALAVPICCRV